MDEASLDDERTRTTFVRTRFAGPILFSVGLHAAVLLLAARTLFLPSQDQAPAERPAIQVALALRPTPVLPDPAPAPAAAEPAPEPEPLPEQPPDDPETLAGLVTAEPADHAEAESADASAPAPALRAWTPGRVRAEIEAASDSLRGTWTHQWIEDCIRERKERGTRDCDAQLQAQEAHSPGAAAGMAAGAGAFASITRPQQQRRLREGFMKDNDALRGLVDADGLLGATAAARYWLNRDYLIYLSGNRVNGNHNDMVFAPMQNFAADVLAGPRLALTGDVPFTCRSKKIDYSRAPAGQVTYGNNVPCTYEFTGFTLERAEREPDEFRVVPQVLGSQR